MVGERKVPRNIYRILHFTLVAQNNLEIKKTALFVINHIKKDFDRGNNISEALRKLEYENTDNWNPNFKSITSSDEDVKWREDRQFELQSKADYGEPQKRKMYYQENQYMG